MARKQPLECVSGFLLYVADSVYVLQDYSSSRDSQEASLLKSLGRKYIFVLLNMQ